MPKINDDVAKVIGFSPRHADLLRAALEGLDHRDILGAARVLGKRCKELRIADFPNPVRDFDYGRLGEEWDKEFIAAYRDETMVPPDEPEEEADPEPDVETMTKADIVEFIEQRYGTRLSMHTNHPTLVQRAMKIIRGD